MGDIKDNTHISELSNGYIVVPLRGHAQKKQVCGGDGSVLGGERPSVKFDSVELSMPMPRPNGKVR